MVAEAGEDTNDQNDEADKTDTDSRPQVHKNTSVQYYFSINTEILYYNKDDQCFTGSSQSPTWLILFWLKNCNILFDLENVIMRSKVILRSPIKR